MKKDRKRKKSIAVFAYFTVALLLLFLLTGCQKEEEKSIEETTPQESIGDDDNNFNDDWPENDLTNLLPKPQSDRFRVDYDSSDEVWIVVADTDLNDYESYVKQCKDAGFKVDYIKYDDWFNAYNSDGYFLDISFKKEDQTMRIEIQTLEEEETEKPSEKATEKPTDKATEKPKKESKTDAPATDAKKDSGSSDYSSDEFRETMDEYESFMNDYVEFIKKYNNSDNPQDMMNDYLDMMKKYNNMMEKINKIDSDKLTAEDYAYYLEVTTRVNKKLLEINE